MAAPLVDPLNPPTLLEYGQRVVRDECQWDGAKLPRSRVEGYQHEGGWYVRTPEGNVDRQWLSIKCPKCGYDWSLNKLGVPRG